MRVRLSDIFVISSQVNGSVSGAVCLSVSAASPNQSLGAVIPRLSTLSGLYRQFFLNSVTFIWTPGQGDQAGGNFSMGVDQAVNAAVPTAFSQVYRHVPSSLGNITEKKSIMWTGQQAYKNDMKYCVQLAGLDEEAVSFGVFQFFGSNSVASVAVGLMEVQVDITFTAPS